MVTIGASYNDLLVVKDFKTISGDKFPLPKDYGDGYTDAGRKQYIVPDQLVHTYKQSTGVEQN